MRGGFYNFSCGLGVGFGVGGEVVIDWVVIFDFYYFDKFLDFVVGFGDVGIEFFVCGYFDVVGVDMFDVDVGFDN